MSDKSNVSELRSSIREHYGLRAAGDVMETGHRGPGELAGPVLGCGNPLDWAGLKAGEDVLDLGSGAGREVIESALRIAPGGVAYGLDMTDEMLALAQENRRRAGAFNAVFLKGTIENVPLPDASVDVIISNCVINLSHDKPAVAREMMRVLRPGGRLVISDTVSDRPILASAKADMDLWCECISGSLQPEEYKQVLVEAGFVNVAVNVSGWDDGDTQGRGFRVGGAIISGIRPSTGPGISRPVPAGKADMPAIAALLEQAGLQADDLDGGGCSLIVMKDGNGQVAAVAGMEVYDTQALFRSLCVRPDLQGRGMGTRLTAALIRMARSQGVKEAFLLTETAEGFGRKRGFRAIDRSLVTGPVTQSEQFRSACPKTATVMKMKIGCC